MKSTMRRFACILSAVAFPVFLCVPSALGDDSAKPLFDRGKLLATGGVSQVEGAGGAGLTTWALIGGYGSDHGLGLTAHGTLVPLDDFTFRAAGLALGVFDRLEVSYSRQWFDTGSTGAALGLGEDFTFGQDIFGAKLRIAGDAVYDQDRWLPQIAVGLQHKRAKQGAILAAVGAAHDKGTDFYIAATKVFLKYSLLANATVRFTKANQFGLLGFGSADDGYKTTVEGSLAWLITDHWVAGVDYRTKPDNLAFAKEEDAMAAYVAWFPSKHVSVTVGYADLGEIALQDDQQGLYLSLQMGF
ncbi:DUF3034 family protein [Gimibacter soli]|uniref:DUF3034 family protein n=1 Tax=Gimibacter soli TaxID=3024400 RepID=A0AAE9XRA5_9PROT|nr:DUF3034 family protein [Gimibacter soli]WCL54836.1 DUF3034 family protein [Gimibacter soli]